MSGEPTGPSGQFAELLFRGDPALTAGAREALSQPAMFLARYGEELGYARTPPGWIPDAWTALLEFAQLHGWLWDVDWRAAADEVIAGVRDLVPAGPLQVDRDGVVAAGEATDTRTFLRHLAGAIEPTGESLVALGRGSDSYPLALLQRDQLSEAKWLAEAIGAGKVELLIG